MFHYHFLQSISTSKNTLFHLSIHVFLSCEKCIFQLKIGWFWDRSWLCHNSLWLISHLIFTLTPPPLPQGHMHPVVSYKKKNKTRFPLCLMLCATLHAACPNSPYKLQWGTQQPITTSCLLNEAGVGHMLPLCINSCN